MDSILVTDFLNLLLNATDTLSNIGDTLIVRTDGIVKVQTVNDNSFDYKFWIAIVISILSIGFIIRDRIKRPKISGKIVSLTFAPEGNLTTIDIEGKELKLSGIKYFFKLSLNVINKNIFYSDVKVKVKYPNDRKQYEGRMYFTNNDKWTMVDGVTKTLRIPEGKFIWYNNVLEKDKTLFLYTSFFVDREFDNFSQIEFVFITPKGKEYKLGPLLPSSFKTEMALYEEEIWN